GWYRRGRGAAEQAETQTYTARRGVLDNDRVVRRELSRELGQRVEALQAAAPTLPPAAAASARDAAGRLREVLQDVQQPGYDSTTWLDQTAARLDARALDQVQRYDDLVLEEARRLEPLSRDLGTDPAAGQRLGDAVTLLAQHVRAREALLGRGQQAGGMSPQE